MRLIAREAISTNRGDNMSVTSIIPSLKMSLAFATMCPTTRLLSLDVAKTWVPGFTLGMTPGDVRCTGFAQSNRTSIVGAGVIG